MVWSPSECFVLDLSWLWIPATLIAAAAQTARNTLQHRLTETLGTLGATQVRFLYGLPFAVLFLLAVRLVEGAAIPAPTREFLAFVSASAVAQILATALMLATMQRKNFALATVYVKTEPILVAIFAVSVLGDPLSVAGAAAVLVATAGVILMSWRRGVASSGRDLWMPALTGIASGACFALASVGFRGAILSLDSGSPLLRASTTLVWSLAVQVAILLVYLLLFQRPALMGSLRVWRASLFAGLMGALASQFWFIGFALGTVASVRTLGLVEVLFAQIISRRLFAQQSSRREKLGAALVIAGVAMLLLSSR
jgi:drug/metabolite transporter (DMT)-like permease